MEYTLGKTSVLGACQTEAEERQALQDHPNHPPPGAGEVRVEVGNQPDLTAEGDLV